MKTKRVITHIQRSACLLATAACITTSCIDEDLSGCETEMKLQYDIRLELNLRNELRSQLTTEDEQELSDLLEERLSNVFTTRASGLDLSFYETTGMSLSRHDTYEINSDKASFTLNMKPDDYKHTAIANTAAWGGLHIANPASYTGMKVEQQRGDTIDGHTTGLFATRRHIDAKGSESKTFSANLFMQNAAVVLALRHAPDLRPASIRTYVRDMAVSFSPADSTYDFAGSPVIRTQQVGTSLLTGCYAVCYPSADGADKTRQRPEDWNVDGTPGLWRVEACVTMPNGRTARNTLTISSPLKAGTVRVLKAELDNEGRIITDDHDVGVSVQLDWESGGDHDVEI